MGEYGRVFNHARKEQGFKSQEALDAWYRYYDHVSTCPECQKQGRSVELDDGLQPTRNTCDIGIELFKLS